MAHRFRARSSEAPEPATRPVRARGAHDSSPAVGLEQLQRSVGNRAVSGLVESLTIRRKILPMGHPTRAGDSAERIANQNEIEVAARELLNAGKGGTMGRFADDDDVEHGVQNYIVGHSDGAEMWGERGAFYSAIDLAVELMVRGVQPGDRVRLLGCNTGVGDVESLSAKTAVALGNLDIPNVQVKGASGEMMRTPGVHGVFEHPDKQGGFDHDRKNAQLIAEQNETLLWVWNKLERRKDGLRELEKKARNSEIARFVNFVKKIGLNKAYGTAIQEAQTAKDQEALDKAIAAVCDQLTEKIATFVGRNDQTSLQSSSKYFTKLQKAVEPFDLAGLDQALANHRDSVLRVHSEWLMAPTREGAVRKSKGTGNVTSVSAGRPAPADQVGDRDDDSDSSELEVPEEGNIFD